MDFKDTTTNKKTGSTAIETSQVSYQIKKIIKKKEELKNMIDSLYKCDDVIKVVTDAL